MELRVLQYFLAVVKEGNISRAADVLHLTQPTLSRQLAQLEDELGAELFIRGRHLEITEAGRMLARRAEEMMALVGKIQSEFNRDLEGVISIGSGDLQASRILPEVMHSFRQLHPGVKFHLYTNQVEHIKDQLEQGLLDFGLLLEPVDVTKFDYLRMGHKERWGLFTRASHPLAQKKTIQREDIGDEPLLISDRTAIQQELFHWLGRREHELNIFGTCNLAELAMSAVDCGIASMLTIEGAVNRYTSERFAFIPLEPALAMSSVFVWKRVNSQFGVSQAFLKHFKGCLAHLDT